MGARPDAPNGSRINGLVVNDRSHSPKSKPASESWASSPVIGSYALVDNHGAARHTGKLGRLTPSTLISSCNRQSQRGLSSFPNYAVTVNGKIETRAAKTGIAKGSFNHNPTR